MQATLLICIVLATVAYAVPVGTDVDLNKLNKQELAEFFCIDLSKEAETSAKLAAWRPGKNGPNPEELGHYFEVSCYSFQHALYEYVAHVLLKNRETLFSLKMPRMESLTNFTAGQTVWFLTKSGLMNSVRTCVVKAVNYGGKVNILFNSFR